MEQSYIVNLRFVAIIEAFQYTIKYKLAHYICLRINAQACVWIAIVAINST